MKVRLGVPGTFGAALLIASAGFSALSLQPLERRYATLLEQSQQAAKRKAHADRNVVLASSGEGRLASFYAFFRRDEAITDHLARLYAFARQAGLEPRTAEYRLAESRGLRLAEYSINMPVTGTYGEVRTFLEYALDGIPVLALDHASVRRKRPADHQVDAELRFTVFLTP